MFVCSQFLFIVNAFSQKSHLLGSFLCFLSYQTTLARFHLLYVTFVSVRVLSSDSHVPEHIFKNNTLTFYNLMEFSWITLSF